MDWSQILNLSAIPALILVALTSLTLLLSLDWRISLLALTLQYAGIFLLILQNWSFEMAATKLVAGWISAALLGMAVNGLVEYQVTGLELRDDHGSKPDGMPAEHQKPPQPDVNEVSINLDTSFPTTFGLPGKSNLGGRIVGLLTAMLVWLTVYTITPRTMIIFPQLGQVQAWAGLLLVGMGLIQLGFSNQAFRVILGLLTILSGFEIFYASIEDSALVAGLLAGISLGLALIGAYLLLAPTMQEEY